MSLFIHSIAKRTAVVALVAALAFTGISAPSANAQTASASTIAALQAQIAALMAQIAALQGGATASVQFTRDLTIGSSGADVTALQQWLIARGFSIPAGATGYFGTQTQSAVAAYQRANGIAPAAGYFGPITRAKVNATVVVPGPTTPTPDDDNDGELEGGAGFLEDADFISGINNEEVGEGEEDVEVLGLELEADDNSDLELTAVRVEFEFGPDTGLTGSEDFDDYAESVSIMFDGDVIATEDVEDFDESSGVWSSTISLDDDAIIRMGETGELTVAVTSHENIDSDDLDDNNWEVTVESIRYMDAQGAVITETSVGDVGVAREFEFATFTSANDVELNVSESTDSPDEGTVEVDEDGDTEVTLLIGELEAEGSDIEITELTAAITPDGTGDVSDIASEFILMIDGDEVATIDSDECTVPGDCDGSGTDTEALFEFNDFEVTVGDGETVEFEIIAITNEIGTATFAEGDSLIASVDADLIEAEDESDELEAGALEGTASGEEQFLRSAGLAVEFLEDESDADADEGTGTFDFVFELTAFGDNEIDLTEADFNYTITAPDGATYTDDATLDAETSVEESGGTFTLDEETGEFTFSVYITPADSTDNGVYTVTVTTIDDSAPTTVNESQSVFISAS